MATALPLKPETARIVPGFGYEPWHAVTNLPAFPAFPAAQHAFFDSVVFPETRCNLQGVLTCAVGADQKFEKPAMHETGESIVGG